MARGTEPTRRADIIRERRAKRARKPASPPKARSPKRSSSRARSQTERSIPPVMVRGSVSGMAAPSRKRKKARRRYDVALGVPGAEIRLPSLPQVRVGWRLVSAVMVALLGLLVYHLWTSPNYQVGAIEAGGLKRVTNREVNAALNVEGESIFALDANEMAQALRSSFPEFSAVSVQVALPHTVAITVTERVPILAWHQGSKTELVDADGVAFPPRLEAAGSGLPVVEAKSSPPNPVPQAGKSPGIDLTDIQPAKADPQPETPNYFMTPDLVKAILTLAKQAPKNTALVYDARHGLGWKDARGWDVYFGDARDMSMKLHVYKAIVAKLNSEDVQPALVSVEYVHAPYYRLDN